MRIFQSINEYLAELEIETFSSDNEFFIFKIEDYFTRREFELKPYQQIFFELTFGSGHDVDCHIGNTRFNSIENTLSFTMPFQTVSWKLNALQEDSIGYTVLFTPKILNPLYHRFDVYKEYSFFNLFTSPQCKLTSEQTRLVLNLLKNIHEEFSLNPTEVNHKVLSSYLTILLERIKKMFSNGHSNKVFDSRAQEITFQFEWALREDVNYKSRIADYASKLNISKTYLSETIKKTTGKSAKKLIKEFIIYRAKSHLKQSNETLETIAFDLGFDDASNFVKYFKSMTGETPNHFRLKP